MDPGLGGSVVGEQQQRDGIPGAGVAFGVDRLPAMRTVRRQHTRRDRVIAGRGRSAEATCALRTARRRARARVPQAGGVRPAICRVEPVLARPAASRHGIQLLFRQHTVRVRFRGLFVSHECSGKWGGRRPAAVGWTFNWGGSTIHQGCRAIANLADSSWRAAACLRSRSSALSAAGTSV